MLKIYNSLTRRKEPFQPIDEKNVRMYVCGMTVYDYCHLGHARVMIVFDIVSRWLRHIGYPLTYVRNITDVDDKIIQRARENKESIFELTERFIHAMNEDAKALGVLPPDIEPKATDYIPQMLNIIERLIENGKAYVVDDGSIYYSIKEFPYYGQLSNKRLEDLQTSDRILNKSEIDNQKRSELDFILWKPTHITDTTNGNNDIKVNDVYWESQYGKGRPGWHIECSAMSESLLGKTFDIHGGGADLQFPHHENELAQSCGAYHVNSQENNCYTDNKGIHSHVKYWLHNGFINVGKDKMSKSLGNFVTIRDVFKLYKPEVLRFFILNSHYRSPLNFEQQYLEDAKNSLTRLYQALNGENDKSSAGDVSKSKYYVEQFHDAMNDDFSTQQAIDVLFKLAKEVNKTKSKILAKCLKDLANILGLLTSEPNEWLQNNGNGYGHSHNNAIDTFTIEKIECLIEKRNLARSSQNWAESDRIRQLLKDNGIVLQDSKNGKTTWFRI